MALTRSNETIRDEIEHGRMKHFPRLKAYVEGLLAACAGGVLSEKNYAHVIGQT